MGYSFGSFPAYPLLFKLPTGEDHILGINGDNHAIGDSMGSETMTLSESNVPAHWHYIARQAACQANPGSNYPYLAYDCYSGSDLLDTGDDKYEMRAHSSVPNVFESGTGSGSGDSFNIMQPTVFIGNLFIYADPQ